jgi:hypothetical protein
MADFARLRPGYGPLIADLDLDARKTWARLSAVERRAPGILACRGSDPQVEIAVPAQIRARLGGVTMELVVQSSIDGRLEVYWDLGTGMSQEQSQGFELRGETADPQTVAVRLPPGVVVLRIDPLDRPGTLEIHSIRFYEPQPAGVAHFPFRALCASPFDGRPGWLDLPEVQQAVSLRLMGSLDVDWPEWLFKRLLVRRVGRCLHLGAIDALFGSLVVGAGYAEHYTGVPGTLMDHDEAVRLPSTPRIAWAALRDALAAGPYDLILTTGFWSRGGRGPQSAELEAALTPDGIVALLERFSKPDPVSDALLARVLALLISSLPPGWLALDHDHEVERPGCRLDAAFAKLFDCREIRPFGGTIAQPLIDRLQPDLLQLGAGTLIGAMTGTYLALEETLILTGLLISPFNLIVASRRGSRLQAVRKLPMGWTIPASADLSALMPSPAPPRV